MFSLVATWALWLLGFRCQDCAAVASFFGGHQYDTRNYNDAGTHKHRQSGFVTPDQVTVNKRNQDADIFERADEGQFPEAATDDQEQVTTVEYPS